MDIGRGIVPIVWCAPPDSVFPLSQHFEKENTGKSVLAKWK